MQAKFSAKWNYSQLYTHLVTQMFLYMVGLFPEIFSYCNLTVIIIIPKFFEWIVQALELEESNYVSVGVKGIEFYPTINALVGEKH